MVALNQIVLRVTAVLGLLAAGLTGKAQEYDKVLVPLPLFDSPATPTEAPPDELLAELTPGFTVPVQGGGAEAHPGYATVPLWLMPELAGVGLVRVEIEPLDETGDYWGFVSSTHNETQHVTVIPPR